MFKGIFALKDGSANNLNPSPRCNTLGNKAYFTSKLALLDFLNKLSLLQEKLKRVFKDGCIDIVVSIIQL
jgi:hypothetical protein